MGEVLWELTDQDRILCARLNRPKANVLDGKMIYALKSGIDERVSKHTHALLLGHEGPHFSFGASVAEHQDEQVAAMLASFHDLFRYLDRLSIPILGSVSGFCLGGGFELALFCHFLFAHPDAKFGQPEIKLGVFPPMASLLLSYQRPAAANDINLTGRNLPASDLSAMGLLTAVSDDPWAAALDYARRYLLDKSAASLRFGVRANRLRLSRALEQDLPELERLYLQDLMATEDANEGIAAFLEKREPHWRDE
jgi:cyclohexa-1,5-dienecarbonyl-CoA hydratase